ncbi:MAG: methylase [Armatimonadetes bacterium CG_4_10_14_3_um_filter_66_18]|nr:MAG: methylase [Armatimonadetes bacterium CG06_land_8_20_14_3_00_66_21]PIX45208.1 MAG: methylase [Armatimonadetes bacterium CG_4_8_14_3_um_filter_66_20]PIY48579.1 MAG: methylase [Armatimonadetes bacterium CG_4_10_14_3_um_filter_66_18]PIZ40282.1 MAG: methylase [Armatimonadetes bacterium CG_4_10_14_0_8_um_filter_66_14]PJB63772.1 MAG: methylase [Armatimonadetes bacterium CG_4_9_14_3_um_filter_66_14]
MPEGVPLNAQEYEIQYRLEDSYWWFVGRRRIICAWLSQLVGGNSDQLLLDIGCGTGTTMWRLRQFCRVVGVDFSNLALARAQSRGLDRLVGGSALSLPFAEGSFGLLTLLDVLEHLKDDAGALRGMRRILRPGGSLLLTVPAYPSLWSQHDVALHHYRRYTGSRLRNVVEAADFRVERLSYAICAPTPLTFAFRWAQGRLATPAAPKTALIQLPRPLNQFLISLLTLEAFALRATALPFGVSLLCHAVRID